MQTDPLIDAYFQQLKNWKVELAVLRTMILACGEGGIRTVFIRIHLRSILFNLCEKLLEISRIKVKLVEHNANKFAPVFAPLK